PHGPEPDGIRIVSQDCGLRLKILAWEVQIRRLRASGALIGDLFGPPKSVKKFESYPGMLAQNAVLDDDVVIALEKAALTVVLVDHALTVVLQQFAQARVAVNRRPTIAVNHRGIASGDAAGLANGRAGVDLTAVEHDVQRLIRRKPMMGDAHRPVL